MCRIVTLDSSIIRHYSYLQHDLSRAQEQREQGFVALSSSRVTQAPSIFIPQCPQYQLTMYRATWRDGWKTRQSCRKNGNRNLGLHRPRPTQALQSTSSARTKPRNRKLEVGHPFRGSPMTKIVVAYPWRALRNFNESSATRLRVTRTGSHLLRHREAPQGIPSLIGPLLPLQRIH